MFPSWPLTPGPKSWIRLGDRRELQVGAQYRGPVYPLPCLPSLDGVLESIDCVTTPPKECNSFPNDKRRPVTPSFGCLSLSSCVTHRRNGPSFTWEVRGRDHQYGFRGATALTARFAGFPKFIILVAEVHGRLYCCHRSHSRLRTRAAWILDRTKYPKLSSWPTCQWRLALSMAMRECRLFLVICWQSMTLRL